MRTASIFERKLQMTTPSCPLQKSLASGLYVFAVKDIEEAKQLTATDPVILKGEMIAEYHKWYGSAAVMDIPRIHETLSEKK